MLLKSRPRTHHPNMHYSYTGVGAKTCFPSRSTQKCSTPRLGVNTKNMLDRFSIHQINAPSSCYYLSKLCCRKEAWGYAKVIHKKEKKGKKELKKWTQKCPRYLKQQVLRCPPKKREKNKIAPALQQMFLNSKREICFQGAQQNQVSHHTYIHHIHLDTCIS